MSGSNNIDSGEFSMATIKNLALAGTCITASLVTINARAQGDQAATAKSADSPVLEEIIITGVAERQLLLDTATETGSRLGLTVRETPATVDILSERQIMEFGARTQIEAFNRAPGVSASTPATSPGIPAMRGFTNDAIGVLYDGVRVASPIFFGRTNDAWSFERIEILKGPASVMFGEGSLAGAINLVPKKARRDREAYQALASYGSFDTVRVAGDANVPLSDTLAVRAVGSYGSASEEIVDHSDVEYVSASLAAEFAPTDRLKLELAFDHSQDDYRSTTLGFPLVPAAFARDPVDGLSSDDGMVLDEAMGRVNYNYTNAVVKSDTQWVRSRVAWEASETFRFTNEMNLYHSDRRFINSEIVTFNAATGLVDRSTGDLTHDIDYWIERPVLAADFQIGGMRNRLSFGGELSQVKFDTPRLFGVGSSVDPYNPVREAFPAANYAPPQPVRSYDIKTKSIFAENALNLTEKWLLVLGGRQEWIDLEGMANGAALDQDYSAFSWRVGTVYDLRPQTQIFAMYSNAIAAPGSFFSMNLARSQFDLTHGRSVEAGIKSTWWDNRFDVTFSAFWLEQDDILTRDPADPRITVQGGKRSSQGVEMSLSVALTESFRVTANSTLLDAEFDELIEAGGADRKGNTPDFVPETVSNLFAFYKLPQAPLNINAGIRHVGRYFGNNANSLRVDAVTLFDAAISYEFSWGEVKLQGRNLADEVYANFTDFGSGQWTLSPGRSAEVSVHTRF